MRDLNASELDVVSAGYCANFGGFLNSICAAGLGGILGFASGGPWASAAGGLFYGAMGGAVYTMQSDGPCLPPAKRGYK